MADALGAAPQLDGEWNTARLTDSELTPDRDLVALIWRWAGSLRGSKLGDDTLLDMLGRKPAYACADALDLTDAGRTHLDAAAVLAAFELGRRGGQASPVRGARIGSASDVAEAVAGELAWLRREHVVVLVCDAADRLRAAVKVSEGALDRALFPIREILHAVLIHDGRSFAVAHNHPSGDPDPSTDDVAATAAIREAAKVVGLRFLGHVIVTDEAWHQVR